MDRGARREDALIAVPGRSAPETPRGDVRQIADPPAGILQAPAPADALAVEAADGEDRLPAHHHADAAPPAGIAGPMATVRPRTDGAGADLLFTDAQEEELTDERHWPAGVHAGLRRVMEARLRWPVPVAEAEVAA